MHLPAKFCQNRSISCEDIKIFQFFKMVATAIFDFQICDILLADSVWSAQTLNCPNFVKINRSVAEILRFFLTFKMAAAAILDFWHRKILLIIRIRRVETHLMINFVKIGQSVAKILRFFDFSRWRTSTILDSFGAYLDHQQWGIVGHYHCKIWVWWCSSFYNMNISIFDAFGWKMPIHAPKMGCHINESQKSTPLRESTSFEPLSVKMWWTFWPVGELLKKGYK